MNNIKLSEKHAELFFKANAGSYELKQSFYKHIKHQVLEVYGIDDGFDLQVIKKTCYSCDGTGIFKHYHWEHEERFLIRKEGCYNCLNGVYMTKEILLKRYLLNDHLYHVPVDMIRPMPVIRESVKGLINHKKFERKEALEAYFKLLFMFNKLELYRYIKESTKRKIIKNGSWIINLVQSMIRKENMNELPF